MIEQVKLEQVLSTRTRNTLARHGLESIEQIKSAYPARLLAIPGFGLQSLREVEAAFFPGQRFVPARREYGMKRQKNLQSEELATYWHTRDASKLR